MTRKPITTTLTVLALSGLVAVGCGADDGDGDGGTSPSSDATATDATATDPADWEEVAPGGDCQCSDGSAYNLWEHQGDPQKVVLFLEDGGACFSAETCDPGNELYKTAITEGPDMQGIFDFDDERNPFADWSVVYAPYCSGDVFLGNATTEYAPGLTIQHRGFANGNAALDHLAATFPDATEVVVVGESAGSIAVPLYAGLAADRFPDARITGIADGSGSYPDDPAITDLIADVWDTGSVMPDWPENAGLTAEQWSSLPGQFVQAGRHAPDVVLARHDYAYDEHQAIWYPYLGLDVGDLLSRMDTNEDQIEAAGVNQLSYTAPGSEHTVLTEGRFYTEEVEGVPLVDWVARLIAGEEVPDVHCDNCQSD
jgi:hypothetical protein